LSFVVYVNVCIYMYVYTYSCTCVCMHMFIICKMFTYPYIRLDLRRNVVYWNPNGRSSMISCSCLDLCIYAKVYFYAFHTVWVCFQRLECLSFIIYMYSCIYMNVCICMYVYTYTYTCVCMHVYFLNACICTFIHVHISAYT